MPDRYVPDQTMKISLTGPVVNNNFRRVTQFFGSFQGKVKQIVGSTLQDSQEGSSSLITNFESDKSAAQYAEMYKDDGLTGGHAIMLGADPLSREAAIEALHTYPGTWFSLYLKHLRRPKSNGSCCHIFSQLNHNNSSMCYLMLS